MKDNFDQPRGISEMTLEQIRERLTEVNAKINEIGALNIQEILDEIKSSYDVRIKKQDFSCHFDDQCFLILDTFNFGVKTGEGKGSRNVSQIIFDKILVNNPNLVGLDFSNNIWGNFDNLYKRLKTILKVNKYIKKLKLDLSDADEEDILDLLENVINNSSVKKIIVSKRAKEIIQKNKEKFKSNLTFTILVEDIGVKKEREPKKEETTEELKEVSLEKTIEDRFEPFKKEYGPNIIKYNISDDGFLVIENIQRIKKKDPKERIPDFSRELSKLISENQITNVDVSYFCKKYSYKDKKTNSVVETRNVYNFIKHTFNTGAAFAVKLDISDFSDDEIGLLAESISETSVSTIILKNKRIETRDKLSKLLPNIKIVFEEDLIAEGKALIEAKKHEREVEIAKLLSTLEKVKDKKIQERIQERIQEVEEFKKSGIEQISSMKSKFAKFEFVRWALEQKLSSIKDEKERQDYINLINETRKLPRKERREMFIDLIRDAFLGITIHQIPDIDAKGIQFVCKIAGLKSDISIYDVEKSFKMLSDSEEELSSDSYAELYSDTLVNDVSGLSGLNIFKTLGSREKSKYLVAANDHHGQESKKGECATFQLFQIFIDLGLIDKNGQDFGFQEEIISFINREDDKYYNFQNYPGFSMDVNAFNNSHKTLYGYTKFINPNNLTKILNCKSLKEKYYKNDPRIPVEFIVLTDKELLEIGLIDMTEEDLLLEYEKEFKEKISFSSGDFYRLEKEYWDAKNKLKKEGKKGEKTNTRLEWLMEKSKKIAIYIENRRLKQQIDPLISNKNNVLTSKYGKIFLQKNIHFVKNPTDILICQGFNGLIEHAGDGKRFAMYLYGDNDINFSDELMSELRDNGVIKTRGMMFRQNNSKKLIGEELFNRILQELSKDSDGHSMETHESITSFDDLANAINNVFAQRDEEDKARVESISITDEPQQDVTKESVHEAMSSTDGFMEIGGDYLDDSFGQINFLNDKELLKQFSSQCLAVLLSFGFKDKFPVLKKRFEDMSSNIVSVRENIATLMLLSLNEDFEPKSSIELDGKTFYFSQLIQNDGFNDNIIMYVDDGKNIFPRLISTSKIGENDTNRFNIYFSKQPGFNGNELLEIDEEDENKRKLVYRNNGIHLDRLHPLIQKHIDDIRLGEYTTISTGLGKELLNSFVLVDDGKVNPYLENNTFSTYTIEREVANNIENIDDSFEYLGESQIMKLAKEMNENRSNGMMLKQIAKHIESDIYNIFGIDKIRYPNELVPDFTKQPIRSEFIRGSKYSLILSQTFEASFKGEPVEVVYMSNEDGKTWIDNIQYVQEDLTTYGTNRRVINCGGLALDPVFKMDDERVKKIFGLLSYFKSILTSAYSEGVQYIDNELITGYELFLDSLVREVDARVDDDYIDMTKFFENNGLIKAYKESEQYKKVLETLHKISESEGMPQDTIKKITAEEEELSTE